MGYDYPGGSNVVDVIIRTVRRKLGERAWIIETVHGAAIASAVAQYTEHEGLAKDTER
jgi:DNA-binding response OmpR family regulator